MPRTRSTISPAKVPKVAEASRLSSSQNQKQDASATLSPTPKGRKTTAHGNALGNRPPKNPSPEGAAPMVDACETGDQLLRSLLVFREQSHQGRGKYTPPIEPIIDGLPKPPGGWTWASADQLTSFVTDGEHQTPERSESGMLLLSARNIHNGFLKLENVDYVPEHEYERISKRLAIQEGDVLLSCSGSVGRTCVAPASPKFTLVRSVAVLRPLTDMGKFMSYALQSPFLQAQILEKQSQTAQANIFQGKIKTLIFPLPPLPEQRRIVARIEELFSRLDAGVAALRHAKAQLQRYRQSVLAAAVTGQLTQAWREQHPDTEQGERLLERILKQRREQWNGRGRYKEPSETVSVLDDEFPNGWTAASLDQLSILVTDGDHNPPKRESSGIPHLTAKHIKKGTITMDKCTFVSEEGFEKTRSRYEPEADDVIVTCVGTIGEVALVPSGIVFSADRNLAAARLVGRGALPRFITCVLTSPKVAKFLREGSGSTAQPHLYLGDLRKTPIPLPPIAEQHQIVAEVEARTTAIDHLEAELDRQITRSNRLRQSTLASAFSGFL